MFSKRSFVPLTLVLAGALRVGSPPRAEHLPPVAPTFTVKGADLPSPLVIADVGDIGYTDPRHTEVSQPQARRLIMGKIASERPAVILFNGDLVSSGVKGDYEIYREEAKSWTRDRPRLYPALGDNELQQCSTQDCLQRWSSAFPGLHGHRWYSVELGNQVLCIILDSNSPLIPGAEQRLWLENQMRLADRVQYVVVVIHHPPVADVQERKLIGKNPRPNEQALADYLGSMPAGSRPPLLVIAGHVDNYERFNDHGVIYLVSGGGGAQPDEIERTDADLWDRLFFPNYHYVRLTLKPKFLQGEMIRLADPAADVPEWQVQDGFRLYPRR
jgi:hypothetical protein